MPSDFHKFSSVNGSAHLTRAESRGLILRRTKRLWQKTGHRALSTRVRFPKRVYYYVRIGYRVRERARRRRRRRSIIIIVRFCRPDATSGSTRCHSRDNGIPSRRGRAARERLDASCAREIESRICFFVLLYSIFLTKSRANTREKNAFFFFLSIFLTRRPSFPHYRRDAVRCRISRTP